MFEGQRLGELVSVSFEGGQMLGVTIRRRVSLDPIPRVRFGGGPDSAHLFSTFGDALSRDCLLPGCIDKVANECGAAQLQSALAKRSRLNLN